MTKEEYESLPVGTRFTDINRCQCFEKREDGLYGGFYFFTKEPPITITDEILFALHYFKKPGKYEDPAEIAILEINSF